MLKDKIKKILDKEHEGDNKKKIENLAVLVVILIVTLIAINLIWNSGEKKDEGPSDDPNKKLAGIEGNDTMQTSAMLQDTLSIQLEEILAKIEGVGQVKVLITYSQTNETIPMYNEDTSQKDTEEKDTSGGTRKVTETDSKREIIYQENNGEKVPITKSIVSPKIEGAIITAQGAGNATVKTNIIQAVEAVTGISSHKIQVFSMIEDGN